MSQELGIESLQFFHLCFSCLWEGFLQYKQCSVWTCEEVFDVLFLFFMVVNFSCWSYLLFSLFLVVYRSVLCDDDPPWCHSSRYTTNHCPSHTTLPCVSIGSYVYYLVNGDKIDVVVWDKTILSLSLSYLSWKFLLKWAICCFSADKLRFVQLKFEGQFWLNFKVWQIAFWCFMFRAIHYF